jgi:hypothetical protein
MLVLNIWNKQIPCWQKDSSPSTKTLRVTTELTLSSNKLSNIFMSVKKIEVRTVNNTQQVSGLICKCNVLFATRSDRTWNYMNQEMNETYSRRFRDERIVFKSKIRNRNLWVRPFASSCCPQFIPKATNPLREAYKHLVCVMKTN